MRTELRQLLIGSDIDLHVPLWGWVIYGVAASGWILWARSLWRDLKVDLQDGVH